MLSCMETQSGLTVIGPKGQTLRFLTNHPAYRAGRDIARQALPAEQVWQQLQDLMADPLKALVEWCERFGVALTGDGETLHLADMAFTRACWLPLLQRAQAVGSSPRHLLLLADKLGAMAASAQVGQVALHLRDDKLAGLQPAILRLVNLPAEARTGDIVTASSTGTVPYLVSFEGYSVTPSGQLQMHSGMVLSRADDADEAADILSQPVILGFNRTYRCEEGTATGWLEDMSFDSLKAAQLNAKEIQESGSDVRIVNRMTGETVSLR